jgi:serine protease Do
VVTNNHVIENADEITIYLSNDDSFSAKIVGRDEKTDIALLKFDPEGKELSVVTFGDSDTLRVGDWVMAIGNPFGLGGSVTAGIVSARGRDIGSGPYDDFIQTDASINRGNSGGPLFNLDGEVIGINTAIFSQSGGSVGIGFAISANLAEQVVTQLRDYGRTRRGWLGVFIQEVTEDIADSLGLKDVAGALVASVSEEGPAAKAGIEAGDVITSFDSKKVERSRDLPRIVAETSVDKTVPVTVIRNGKEIVIDVTLGELEVAENDGLISNRPTAGEAESFADLGFDVRPLTEELATQYGLKPEENTVVITSVAENSPASRKGLEEGLIIRRLNQTAITSVEQLNEGISAARDEDRKGILMLIEDAEGRSRFVQVSFE